MSDVSETSAVARGSTLVIEGDVIPRRLRRPADLLRLVLVLGAAAVVLAAAYFASSTATGLDHDITVGATKIPHLLVTIANLVGALGLLLLPIAAGIDLLIRKRARQLVEAFATLVVTLVVVIAIAVWIQNSHSQQLLVALTGLTVPGPILPLNGALAAIVAFSTVARLIDRPRWAAACAVVVIANLLANIVAGGITVAALALSALMGWAIGLAARYLLGTPTTRPSGLEVAAAMEKSGFPLTVLRATHETTGGRRYSATTGSGARLEVLVLDRDLEGSGLVRGAWRSIRIRGEQTLGFSMRSRLEHAALQAYAAQAAGAPLPRLEAVVEVGPDAALLAYERIDGVSFAQLGGTLTDDDLDGAWRALRTLQEGHLSHRALFAEHMLRDTSGNVWLLDSDEGSVAAGDVAQRLDIAEMLCTLAMLTDPDRAVFTGRRVLGTERLAKALPVLQPVALTPVTRKAMKRRKDVLVTLRENLEAITPEGSPVEQIRIERMRPRTIITAIAGTVAAYLLLIQLGKVDLAQLVRDANWGWAVVAVLLSAATYIGAAMSIEGFVPERLNLWRTLQAQLAASFATLVSPPTLGAVAVNVRYLQQSGVHPALAAASIGVSQVAAFVMHLLLILGFGVIAGTRSELDVTPPAWTLWVGVALIILILAVLLLPMTRNWAINRVRPILQQVGPRLLTLAQQPLKLVTGIGGILLLNLGYCLCLIACVRAFGGGGEWAAICVVYLAGATIGQAAPTPGGLGAVEAALTAGLAAAGVEGGVAVSAVLLFRVFTFWLPTIPGWFSFSNLQKTGYL